MTEEKGLYPSVILPGKVLGTDLLLLGRRVPKEQSSSSMGSGNTTNKKDWLLIKIQAITKYQTNLKIARLSLEFPYGVNRGEAAKVEEESEEKETKAQNKNKKKKDKKVEEFEALEKECVVVHVICRIDNGKQGGKARICERNGKTFVEILIDKNVWESDDFLKELKLGIGRIWQYKRTKRLQFDDV